MPSCTPQQLMEADGSRSMLTCCCLLALLQMLALHHFQALTDLRLIGQVRV